LFLSASVFKHRTNSTKLVYIGLRFFGFSFNACFDASAAPRSNRVVDARLGFLFARLVVVTEQRNAVEIQR